MTTLTEDLVLYRAGRSGGGRNAFGQWFTREPTASVAKVRLDLAVKAQWVDVKSGVLTGTSPIEATYALRIPKGTTIYEGPTAYQGGAYLGGQDMPQVFVETPWKNPDVSVLSESPLL